jgi:hypothetical protein
MSTAATVETEFERLVRVLAELRDAVDRAAEAHLWTPEGSFDTAPDLPNVRSLAAEIHEEIEIVDQFGTPYNSLVAACGLIEAAAERRNGTEPAGHQLDQASDLMGQAIESLRAGIEAMA